jgi:hypothetical protein
MNYSNTERPFPNDPLIQAAFTQARKTLNDMSEKRTQDRAKEVEVIAKYTQALQAPFAKIIAESPEASSALKELRQRKPLELTDSHISSPVRGDRSNGPMFNLHLQEHLSVIGAPYDFDWQWGNPVSGFHNRLDGQIIINTSSGHVKNGASDRVEAAAGIGLAITTDRPATVSVRPFITYEWQYGVAASGLFSSAETKGGADAAAFLDGALIDGVKRSEFFSDSQSWAGTTQNSGGGIVWVPDVTLGFSMQPGQVVIANFGVWAECDHSSGIGVAGAIGNIKATVSWIVVERFL